jgi:hypothetical protein
MTSELYFSKSLVNLGFYRKITSWTLELNAFLIVRTEVLIKAEVPLLM